MILAAFNGLDRLEAVPLPAGGQKLVHKTKILGITGSWLKGYEQDSTEPGGRFAQGGYVERAAMAPVPLGGLLITARPVAEHWGWRWDLKVTA